MLQDDLALDSLQNILTAAESSVDPSANNTIVSSHADHLTWYSNGGIASTIVDYWPALTGSGITLEYDTEIVGKKAKDIQNIIDYLTNRLSEINLVSALVDINIQASITPIGIAAIESKSGVITNIEPLINQRIQILNDNYIINSVNTNKENVLIYKGKNSYINTYNNSNSYSNSYSNKYAPLIDKDTVIACTLYQQAITAANNLIQKKNYISLGVSGYNQNIIKDKTGSYADSVVKVVKIMQKTTNILNVELSDKDETEIKVIERNLANVDNVIDKIRDYLLATTNNIPETRLFGFSNKGGLSKSNDDKERTESEANRIFNLKWLSLIKQVINRLLLEPSAPNSKFINSIVIKRKSNESSDPLLEARVRLLNAQALAIESRLSTNE